MEVAGDGNPRQGIEFGPRQLQWLHDEAANLKIPTLRIKMRDRSVVENRPLQSSGLPGRKTALRFHFLLELPASVPFEEHGVSDHKALSLGGQLQRSEDCDSASGVWFVPKEARRTYGECNQAARNHQRKRFWGKHQNRTSRRHREKACEGVARASV